MVVACRFCCVCRICIHNYKEKMSEETCWHQILRVPKQLTLYGCFIQVYGMCNDGSILLCYVNAVVVGCYTPCGCRMCNCVMLMVCSGVIQMHAGCVRPSYQLQIFPFVLWGRGMCNGVMLIVCSGIIRMHAGSVRLACQLHIYPFI